MAYYEVGYDTGDGIYSVNIIFGNDSFAYMCALKHAEMFGYKLAYFKEVSEVYTKEMQNKGMPVIRVGKEMSA